MGFFAALKGFFAPHKIDDLAALQHFVESRSAFLAQKSITEYTQARANMLFSTMMREPLFLENYEKARWRSFPAAVSMVSEMVEGAIRRECATPPGSLDGALVSLVAAITRRYAVPSGFGEVFWNEATERVARDLAKAALGPPKEVQAIPFARASEIFDALPANDRLKAHDFAMFRNTIRFHLTEIAGEFEERRSAAKLAAALSA